MIELIDGVCKPLVFLLAIWSLRWAVAIALLGAGLIFWPPRRAATHLLLCRLVLIGGLLLPVLPRYWGPMADPATGNALAQPLPQAEQNLPAVSFRATASVSTGSPVGPGMSRLAAVPIPKSTGQSEEAAPAQVVAVPASDLTSPHLGADRILLLVVTLVWLTGIVLLGSRLVVAWRRLGRLRRSAQPASPAALELFQQCRSELHVSRSADLLTHPAVRAPVLLGTLHPAILLPPRWDDLSLDHRRAALIHELFHLARRDDWAKVFQEIVRVFFFFHPLVHWLLGRLESERERQCDAAVVRLGMPPEKLARVLLDFAKLVGPGQTSLVLGRAVPFLNRITVKDRIHQLLESDMTQWIMPLSRGWTAGVAAIALGSIAVLGSFGLATGAIEDVGQPPAAAPIEARHEPAVSGVVQNDEGRGVMGATVVLQRIRGRGQPLLTQTGEDGKFTFASLPSDPPSGYGLILLAAKAGLAPADHRFGDSARALTLILAKPASIAGAVKDREGKPVAGAKVQFGTVQRFGNGASWGYAGEEALRGTPLQTFFITTSDAQGKFCFTSVPTDAELIFRAEADGFGETDTAAKGPMGQHFAKADAPPVNLVLAPEARLNGRVVSRIPGAKIEGLRVWLDKHGIQRQHAQTDALGRFSLRGLPEGSFGVLLDEGLSGSEWVARTVPTIQLRPANTCEVEVELIKGAVVEGTVVASETGKPLAGVRVRAYTSARPRTSSYTAETDKEGRYRFHLPPGETDFHVFAPAGFTGPPSVEGVQKVVIAEGVDHFAGPKLMVVRALALAGVVVDARGTPVAKAEIIGLCRGAVCVRVAGQKVTTDVHGRFRIENGPEGPFPLGELTSLEVAVPGGKVFEIRVVVVKGEVEVRLPTIVDTDVKGPDNILAGELAGVVVDDKGKALEGVHVHVWDWVDKPEYQTRTGQDGIFRIKNLSRNQKVQVRFRKPGFSPVMFVQQPTGVKGLVVVMDSKTYFEGTVYGPDGKPAPNAIIRADQGPKMADGGLITTIWTDTKADESGRYRLYVEPDGYVFLIKAPGVGVARLPKTPIVHGQARTLDIHLKPGVTFRAVVSDAGTGKPVSGVRLWHWQHKGVEGRSDGKGELAISEMLPGPFQFDVEAEGYARWWSPEAISEWNRYQPQMRPGSDWQRNFDNLDFDLKSDMAPVKVVLEKGVRIAGRVVDPAGKPVAGATVAPALTGTGNSLTGDTRFSVETKKDGTFAMMLPASGKAQYNLVAHDGKYGRWRQWANGVLPPFQTTPGQERKDVELILTKPATVRGKVVDAMGKPMAFHEVRAHAADKLENRYYDPTTTTKEDGSYELRFIRPGEHFIQAAPFWLTAEEAPSQSTRQLRLAAGETVEAVVLVGGDQAK
jgi:protocatechuate 3,4-dioxygenase beta subunit